MPEKQDLEAIFFQTPGGAEPVRDWLKSLEKPTRSKIGAEIRWIQQHWPVGPPRVGAVGEGVWEVRVTMPGRNQFRTFFAVSEGRMYLLHGMVKNREAPPGGQGSRDRPLAVDPGGAASVEVPHDG